MAVRRENLLDVIDKFIGPKTGPMSRFSTN